MIVVSRAARRSIVWVWAVLAAFGPAASDTLAQSALPFRIPDFCATATITSAASRPWSSPANWSPNRIPIAGDAVRINNGHIVTNDAVGDVAMSSRHFISIDEISNSFLPMKEGGFQWLFLAGLALPESAFSSGGICSKR
jgi:hypothetical protein